MSTLKNQSIDNSSSNKFYQLTLVLQPHIAKCYILRATNKISNIIVLSSVNQNVKQLNSNISEQVKRRADANDDTWSLLVWNTGSWLINNPNHHITQIPIKCSTSDNKFTIQLMHNQRHMEKQKLWQGTDQKACNVSAGGTEHSDQLDGRWKRKAVNIWQTLFRC